MTLEYTADQMREYGRACAEAARQPASVVAVNSDDPNIAQNWIDNAKYLLDSYPNAVRVCEGSGPENLLSSLILNFIALRDAAATNRSQP